jgi:hypothetical protein
MKKLIVAALAVLVAAGASAQNKRFEGMSGSVALSYTTIGSDITDFVSGQSGRSYTVRVEDSKHLAPQIGLEYTGHVDGNFYVSVGADYQSGKGKTAKLFFDGEAITDTVKGSLGARWYVAPSVTLDEETLAYFKLGFTKVKGHYNDGTVGSDKVRTYGLGVKFLADEKGNYFAEWNTFSGKKKSRIDEDGNTFKTKGTGSMLVFGYNAKF